MKNASFVLKNQDEKRDAIENTIYHKTRRSLTEEQMRTLMMTLKSNRQYEVNIYTDPHELCEAIVLVASEDRHDTGTVVFGQVLPGRAADDGFREARVFDAKQAAAVVICRIMDEAGHQRYLNQLQLYIPARLYAGRR